MAEEVTHELVKAKYLIQKYGEETAQIVAREVVEELSDLPRIPYNERREKFWREVKKQIENS